MVVHSVLEKMRASSVKFEKVLRPLGQNYKFLNGPIEPKTIILSLHLGQLAQSSKVCFGGRLHHLRGDRIKRLLLAGRGNQMT